MTQDTRWIQRFDNFNKVFNELTADVALRADRPLSRIEEKGLIQSFEIHIGYSGNGLSSE